MNRAAAGAILALPLLAVACLAWRIVALNQDHFQTPSAANNIHEQHYQMHRFVTGFHAGPIAVNDLGWVSYRNDGCVLDIYGLGARLAIVYDAWAEVVPPIGVRLADLRLSRPAITPAFDTVTFYATDPAAAAAIAAEPCRFAPTLPPGPTLRPARPCP